MMLIETVLHWASAAFLICIIVEEVFTWLKSQYYKRKEAKNAKWYATYKKKNW